MILYVAKYGEPLVTKQVITKTSLNQPDIRVPVTINTGDDVDRGFGTCELVRWSDGIVAKFDRDPVRSKTLLNDAYDVVPVLNASEDQIIEVHFYRLLGKTNNL